MKSNTKILLNKDIKKLGKAGTILSVSSGYAYNYLIPNKLAQIATLKVVDQFKHRKIIEEQKITNKKIELEKVKNKLQQCDIFSISRKVGKKQVIFGSVTNKDIASTIKSKLNIDISKNNIMLKNKIRTLGNYEVTINLGLEISTVIAINVITS